MSKMIADSHYDIGGYRDVYEDRVKTTEVKTAGGLKLMVAAVADGVGGENKGERAAQTALDALFGYLEKSKEKAIPALLTQAVQYANKAVFQLQHETGGASTTLAVAVVDEDTSRLYVANVGDSRIYLCRNQKLTQLTIDHSWATVMVWQGKVSPEAARDHPRANVLMRAIGMKDQIDVDLGFYVGTMEYEEANTRGMEGLPLQSGDSVLVCSDGLIKDSPKTGEALITTEEIIRTVNEKEGMKAVKELVSFALGRGPDDNISAALIQLPDRWRSWRARRPMLIAGALIFGLAVVLGLVIYVLTSTRKELKTLAQQQTATEAMAQSIGSRTPTPSETSTPSETPTPSFTPTLSPTLTPQPSAKVVALEINGVISYTLASSDAYQPLIKDVPVDVQPGLSIRTANNGKAKLSFSDNSILYIGQDTSLVIKSIAGPATGGSTVFTLDKGMLLVETTGHATIDTSTGHSAGVVSGLMGVRYNVGDVPFHVDCLEGSCTVSIPDQMPITLSSGRGIGTADGINAPAECALWIDLAGERVKCEQTPTPEITLTPTETSTGAPLPTNIKIPTKTYTQKPKPQKTTRVPTTQKATVTPKP